MLFAGAIANQYNRRIVLGAASICWAISSIGTALTHTFLLLCTFRMMLGVFESFSAPTSYSLIADYFPPDKRSTANSIIQAGNYIGVGLSSISILLISKFGW